MEQQGDNLEPAKRLGPSRRGPGRRTTLKNLKYARALVEGKKPGEARELAGYAPTTKTQDVEAALPHEAFVVEMEAQGLTVQAIVSRLVEGLGADTTVALMHQKTGEVHERTYTDYATRHKYLDTAIRLAGGYPKSGDARAQDQGSGINLVTLVQQNVHLDEGAFLEAMQRARLRLGQEGGQ